MLAGVCVVMLSALRWLLWLTYVRKSIISDLIAVCDDNWSFGTQLETTLTITYSSFFPIVFTFSAFWNSDYGVLRSTTFSKLIETKTENFFFQSFAAKSKTTQLTISEITINIINISGTHNIHHTLPIK